MGARSAAAAAGRRKRISWACTHSTTQLAAPPHLQRVQRQVRQHPRRDDLKAEAPPRAGVRLGAREPPLELVGPSVPPAQLRQLRQAQQRLHRGVAIQGARRQPLLVEVQRAEVRKPGQLLARHDGRRKRPQLRAGREHVALLHDPVLHQALGGRRVFGGTHAAHVYVQEGRVQLQARQLAAHCVEELEVARAVPQAERRQAGQARQLLQLHRGNGRAPHRHHFRAPPGVAPGLQRQQALDLRVGKGPVATVRRGVGSRSSRWRRHCSAHEPDGKSQRRVARGRTRRRQEEGRTAPSWRGLVSPSCCVDARASSDKAQQVSAPGRGAACRTLCPSARRPPPASAGSPLRAARPAAAAPGACRRV